MIFTELDLPGVFLVDSEAQIDERGSFVRTYCREEFARRNLCADFAQGAIARNPLAGTLRGLHYQREPHWEEKLVRCIAGEMYDVIVDLRPHSPQHCKWIGVNLSAQIDRAIYIPKGCAHGYLTLSGRCEVAYQLSRAYDADHAAGVRWDDPAFAIRWPTPVRMISARDRKFPDYRP